MDHVRKRVEARNRFLAALYAIADGRTGFSTTTAAVGARAGLVADDAIEAARWFGGHGDLEVVIDRPGWVRTTERGARRAARLGSAAPRPVSRDSQGPETAPEPRRSTQEAAFMSRIRIFVSHAASDVQLARGLIALVEACLNVPEGAIRCTSVPGYRLDGGNSAGETLRRNLEECSVVVALLTKASLESSFVLMELGAAWGFRKTAIPLLAPGLAFEDLPGPFKDVHALQMSDVTDVASLIETLGKQADLPARDNRPKEQAALAEFVASCFP
jgi:hypothetical protein